ncbi:MAG TPA: ATP-binding protein [Steroidobacteraceae bacterium]|nr:ATP-binding protein [Steroidobacteraceae bacterium]
MGAAQTECVPTSPVDIVLERDARNSTPSASSPETRATEDAAHDFLAGGGEMGALIRAMDWSKTAIGAPHTWSPTLRTLVGFLLANRFPILLWWGPQYIQIYNDAYRPIPGTKHPKSLGQAASQCWTEIWDIIGPLIDTPFHGGPATWMEDIALEINRHGFMEETHFTIAYSPVPDETAPRGIGGVIATVHEITPKVVGERRVAILRDLGASAPDAKTAEEACAIAAQTLARHTLDVPFILLYLMEPDGSARLAGAAGLEVGGPMSPETIPLAHDDTPAWPLQRVIAAEELHVVEGLDPDAFGVRLGPWSDPPHTAVIVPIRSSKAHELAGIMVAGVSARLKLDELYRSFFELVATQIAAAISKARAYEEERKRAEALAELDHAKTLFFSNVSHEFRTPLTLMLGPLEELRASVGAAQPEALEQIESAHRNALRLSRLVNALLEFSRIEAGRMQATYEPIDLAALTTELASTFRSACEKAGLRLTVMCDPLTEPAYVDRDMWEKIVVNLLSNAFKFTFEGEISVTLRRVPDGVELRVADTGTGIPAEEIPRLFERFHRIHGARGRSVEGTGIGLALVQELVKLHGGSIRAESVHRQGTTFCVHLPLGSPTERSAARVTERAASSVAQQFANEALQWLADETRPTSHSNQESADDDAPAESRASPGLQQRPHILVADDNADLRAYLRRLLGPSYRVTAVADGERALRAARDLHPDLVLADIMMPNLDGIGLVKALRADAAVAGVPVILLSARAGEEAKIEGLDIGADDYLVKPFSAQELLARVRSQLTLSHARGQLAREQEASLERVRIAERFAELQKQDFNALLMQAPNPFTVLRGPDYRIELVNPVACRILGRNAEEVIGRPLFDVLPELRSQGFKKLLDGVVTSGVPYEGREVPARFARRNDGSLELLYFNFVYTPLRDGAGKIDGVLMVAFDVTAAVAARTEIERLKSAAESANRAKDEFLAMLGHELRNPLSPIKTALDVMRLRGVQSPEQAIIERQVVHLTRLVDDLLDVSRIAGGKIDLRKEPIEVAEAALRAIEMASPILEQRNHRLEFRIARNGLQVEADPERFAQILSNLLTNAAKYSDPGSRISMVASRENDRVRVSVKDEGIGIAPDMLERIFDLFVQEPQSIDRSRGGLGLGLTIVRNLVRLHGGTVTAHSAGPGKGSEFVLEFPLLDSALRDDSLQVAARRTPSALVARRVLVVDDNNDAATTLKLGLEAIGHIVVTAPDGPTALELARMFRPEVAFLDIGLPAMDGYELARHIREVPGMPADLKLIAITGYGLESDRQRASAAGFSAHLVKPVSFDSLAALCSGPNDPGRRPTSGTH